MELLAEIRRLRPTWYLAKPNLAAYWLQRADWEGRRGFWHRVRTRPDWVAGHLAMIEGNMMDTAREAAKKMRDAAREFETFESIDLSGIRALPLFQLRGWRGDAVEPWRLDSLRHYTTTLIELPEDGGSSASWDWLAPWVDLEAIRRDVPSWNGLFLYELSSDRMRRNWLRWAFSMVQATRRTTDGTPGDNQLAGYLTDVETFATADRGFADVVAKVATQAWFALARAVTVPGDRNHPPEEVLSTVAGVTITRGGRLGPRLS